MYLSRATALLFYALFYAPERNIFLFTNNIAEFQRNFKEISKKFKNFKIFLILGGAKTRFLRNIYEKVKDGGHYEYR